MSVMISKSFCVGIDYSDSDRGASSKSKETLVCLHGIGGDDASFIEQSKDLPDYRIISWNMPGYQQSTRLNNITFSTLTNSLHDLLIALKTGPVHIVGQSIGGMIAQEYALLHSENVKSLTLVATTSAFGGRDDSFKDAFLKARTAKNVSEEVIAAAVKSMAAVPVETYTDILKCLVTFNRRTDIAEIRCPVCLVAGSEDTNSPAATMKKMAEKMVISEFHEIRNAGHLVNLEKAGEFNRILQQFINKHFA